MMRPTLIDLNPAEPKKYLLMVSLGICNGSCNTANDLATKICVPSERKNITVKVFNMITRINKAKTLVKIFHVIVHGNSIVQHVFQIRNAIMINVSVIIILCGNWNPSTYIST